jgi:hypothetical protein
MAERSVIEWQQVARDANSIFRVWENDRELQWAEKSWHALAIKSLTSYHNQVERTLVMIRLMALAAIYRDFCELAFDEVHEPEYSAWADELQLSTFRLAQCAGTGFEGENEAEDDELLECALTQLMAKARSEIHHALRAEFGDDSLLFVSLWNTVEYWRPEGTAVQETKGQSEKQEHATDHSKAPEAQQAEIDWLDDADGILNTDITAQKLAAHNWIKQGMQSLH